MTASLTRDLKALAGRLDFALVGVCPAVEPTGLSRFHEWLARGYAGQMHYLAARSEAYEHPRHVLEGVRSILVLGMPYRTAEPQPAGAGHARISRYAWGSDYHDLIRDRLAQLRTLIAQRAPGATCRGVVDTAPLLERELAQMAGLGWIGKNTLLLNRQLGSWFFLAALLTDLELEFDQPQATDHCGTCRACLDACPTGALVEPYVLDARRCISYLTIELRGAIPMNLRSGVGDWLFGCDICQDVCPWNSHAAHSTLPAFHARDNADPTSLTDLFFLSFEEFRALYRDTPLWRPRRRGILRNAAIALGNQAPWPNELRGAIEQALIRGLNDAEPLVRGASAWALAQAATPCAAAELHKRLILEADVDVRAEIADALATIGNGIPLRAGSAAVDREGVSP